MSTSKDAAFIWKRDLATALIAMVVLVAIGAIGGFKELWSTVDNDSLLRLVEVRDLLAGQGWFDLHQYRMGAEGGFIMHWSRLVDAPIAAIIVVVSTLTRNVEFAETVARIAWPTLLYGANMVFIARGARNFGGEQAVVPSLIIGAAALYFIGIFAPGSLDHHNIQLVLTTASLCFLLESRQSRTAAALSGVCSALSMAIGMETAPYVAVAGLSVAALFLLDGDGERRSARGFGLGFAGANALVFLTTIAPSQWGVARCDAFSSFQFVMAGLAGIGLAAIASVPACNENRIRRTLSIGMLGILLGAAMVVLFPQCIAAPFSDMDPRLKDLWFGNIVETQPLWHLLVADPASAVGRYVTPLVAIYLLATRMRAGAWRRQDSIVGAMLVAAFLVSAWQVRGSNFSIVMAVFPLSVWVGGWRQRASARPSLGTSLRMVAVWLVSINAIWMGAATATSLALENGAKTAARTGDGDAGCERVQDFAQLARQPATTVLAVANAGSSILAYSDHRALAGLYHRDVAGNLATLDAFVGSPDQARDIVAANHVGIVAFCRGAGENMLFKTMAPQGLMAQLEEGKVPAWLELIDETRGHSIELYRVLHPG